MNLTNQELLKELERRIENGTITVDFDQLVDNQNQSNSPNLKVNPQMLLGLGVGVLIIWLLYNQNRTKTSITKFAIKINES